MKKGFHKTKDGRVAKKGLYYYANKRRKAGKNLLQKAKKVLLQKPQLKEVQKLHLKEKGKNEKNYKSTKRISFYEK